MAAYQLLISSQAAKDIQKIPRRTRDRLKKLLLSLGENPFLGKKLKGELEDKYSYRIWPYRIIYIIYEDRRIIYILRIRHRQGAY